MTTLTVPKLVYVSPAGGALVKDDGGATLLTLATGDIVVVCTVADVDPVQPRQQNTVGQYPALNPDWIRNIRASDAAVSLVRNGANGVAIYNDVVCAIAAKLEQTITWTPPVMVADPADKTGTFAKGVLTSNGTAPNDGDTVTIGLTGGSKVYTFKTTLTPTEGEVLINTTAANALINLKRAIDHTGTPDTDYKCAAAHTQVKGGAITATTLQIISKAIGTASNSYATTTNASPRLAWGGAVMSGGTVAPFFVASFGSELLPMTFAWHESDDGTFSGGHDTTLSAGGIYGIAIDSTGLISTLTLTVTDTSKTGYYYRCVGTDSATVPGSVTSAAAILSVT